MKVKIIEIGNDLEEKELSIIEVNNQTEAIQKTKEFIENKFRGLWIDAKPFGYLKTKNSNIGIKSIENN